MRSFACLHNTFGKFELYSRYQATGCGVSFTKLFEAHNSKLVKRLRKSYRLNRDDAEDVCQESWACLAKRGVMFQEGWTFAAWLFQAAKRRAIDFKRSTKNEGEQTEQLRQHDICNEETPSIEERIISDETCDRLLDAISDLPPASAEAIRLTAFYGLSVVETAYRFKVTRQAMVRRLSLARNFLKEALV